jgi:hypothetical protein
MADGDFGPKLTHTVVGTTSEDETFPASSLERHTARARGWHSSKLAEFPLEIVFAFDGLAEMTCLRILAHESKVPAKVDLFIYTPDDAVMEGQTYPEPAEADFRRLGFINFSNNEVSNYCARELKTVRIRARALYLKFVIRGCHANSVNMFNQAGLVAVDFHGTLLVPFRRTARQALLAAGPGSPVMDFDAEVQLQELTPVKAPSSATGNARRRIEEASGGARRVPPGRPERAVTRTVLQGRRSPGLAPRASARISTPSRRRR